MPPTAVLWLLPLLCGVTPQAGDPPASGYPERFAAAWRHVETGELAAAREAYLACLELRPESATCAFHLACLEARDGDLAAAREWLERAVAWGFDDAAVLAWEPDLEPLRERGGLEPLLRSAADTTRERTERERSARLVWTADTSIPQFSPDGERIVSGLGEVCLWDVRSGERIAVLPPGEAGIDWSVFSPCGRFLVTFHPRENAVRVWNARTGRFSHRLEGDAPPVARVSFSADGGRILLATATAMFGASYVWNLPSGERIAELPPVELGAMSPDGSKVLTEKGLWLLDEARWLGPAGDLGGGLYAGDFSADGRLGFVLAGKALAVQVFDAATGMPLHTIGEGSAAAPAAGLVAGGDRIATRDPEGIVVIWDAGSGEALRRLPGLAKSLGSFAIDPTGRRLLAAGDQMAQLWDLERGVLVWDAGAGASGRWYAYGDFSPDGDRVVLSFGGEILELRDAATGEVLGEINGTTPGTAGSSDGRRKALRVTRLDLHPGGGYVALGCSDGTVREVEVATGRTLRSVAVGERSIAYTRYSGDGRWRLDHDAGGRLVLREVGGASILVSIGQFEPDWSVRPQTSHDGSRVLVRDGRGDLALWDREQGIAWRRPPPQGTRSSAAALSADGRLVAVAEGNVVHVLDAGAGEPAGPPIDHSDHVQAVAFSEDGTRLATGCNDGFARVWSLAERELERELYHDDIFNPPAVSLVRFDAEGSKLLTTTSSFHYVTLWDLTDGHRLWRDDYSAGNPVTLPASFSGGGERVCVWGSFCGTSSVYDLSGERLADLSEACLGHIAVTPDLRFVVGVESGSASVYDGRTFQPLFQHLEQGGGGALVTVPSLHVAGSSEALSVAHVVFEDGSVPLDSYAERLLDPRKVAASQAGVDVRRPGLPLGPVVELAPRGERVRPLEGDVIALEAVAEDPLGLVGFEVERDGVQLGVEEVRAATTVSEDGGRAELRLRLPRPEGASEVSFEVRALGKSLVLSAPARVTFREVVGEDR